MIFSSSHASCFREVILGSMQTNQTLRESLELSHSSKDAKGAEEEDEDSDEELTSLLFTVE